MLPTRLPDKFVKLMLVSGEYPQLADTLRQFGINVVMTMADERLPGPVQWHPDMQACVIGGKVITLKDSYLCDVLKKLGLSISETQKNPAPAYPKDVLCNVLAWNGQVLGNPKTADRSIRQIAKNLGSTWISVKQGYTACAVALVDKRSAITADVGIADCLERHGMQVLRISAGAINLPGYPYGFIGGCCGKLAPHIIAFTGKLNSHPEGEQILTFLSARDIHAVELFNTELLDVGGLIALC